ncbi:MAG: hypothetical protein EOM05_09790, partial [Clostridia bacterium]|nr:hypothetical protein [Clostridia bacterium]
MKALDFLVNLKQSRDFDGNLESSLDEAIAELEAQQQPKSCKGCKEGWEREKQTFHKFYCEYLRIPVHGDFYCNRYKPKE